jgi:hypothetical protein
MKNAASRLNTFNAAFVSTLILPVVVILLANFIANFLFFEGFGFYEDDYLMTIPAISWGWSDYFAQLQNAVLTWPQGRPLFWVLMHTYAFALGLVGSLPAYHLFTFGLTSLAGIFLYTTLLKFSSAPTALAGTLFYLLFPADTGKQIFMHMPHFATCLILTTVAIRAYLSKSYKLFYAISIIILLIYEAYLLPLFCVPLLISGTSARDQIRSFVTNGVLLLAILAAILLLRSEMGEERASDVLGSGSDYVFKILTAPAIGSWTAIKLGIVRPLEVLIYSSPWGYVVMLFVFAGFASLFSKQLKMQSSCDDLKSASTSLRLVFAGAAMFAIAYTYRFYPAYYPPTINIGRLSSLHSVSALGAAILFCGIAAIGLQKCRKLTIYGLAVYFALLVVFGLEIQTSQYVRYWELQKAFLKRVMELTQDALPNEPVVVNLDSGFDKLSLVDSRPATEGFPPIWIANYPYDILGKLIEYPQGAESSPQIFGFWEGAQRTVIADGVRIGTPPWHPPSDQPILKNGSFILLEWRNGNLVRGSEPLKLGDAILKPREARRGPVAEPKHGKLYNLFFKSGGVTSPLGRTLIPSINYPPQG